MSDCGCTRPTRAGYVLCDTCKAELEQHLAEIGWLAGELNVSLTRVKGVDYNRNGGRSADKPLPWNEGAAKARENLKAEMVSWVRIIAASTDKLPKDSLVSIAAWLLYRLERVAKREDAWVIYDTITGASLEARSFVFAKPAEKHFIGPCEGRIEDDGERVSESECVGEIFLTEGSGLAECGECLRAYDPVAAIRARDEKMRDVALTPSEIASLGHRALGQPRKKVEGLLNIWIKRERITLSGHHFHGEVCARRSEQTGQPCRLDGQPTYNYGAVTDMLREAYSKGA